MQPSPTPGQILSQVLELALALVLFCCLLLLIGALVESSDRARPPDRVWADPIPSTSSYPIPVSEMPASDTGPEPPLEDPHGL